MKLDTIKNELKNQSIFFADDQMLGKPSVIGYDKKFRWSWLATQLNTFIVATDFGDETITVAMLEKHLTTSFAYATKHYTGSPRGLQSGLGVISVLISSKIDEEAKEYCRKLKSGKKWAGFSIPVAINASTHEVYSFERNPVWGAIYYPYFRKLIEKIG